jgi:hypothetical protein
MHETPLLQVLPSGGLISVSLWDVDDPEALKAWLDENLGQDCANEVNEVSRFSVLLLGDQKGVSSAHALGHAADVMQVGERSWEGWGGGGATAVGTPRQLHAC